MEREVNRSKKKLQTASEAEALVNQMVDRGYLVQDANGSYDLRVNPEAPQQ